MANLRTNNLSGEGGRNAYRGSVFFDGQNTRLEITASSDLALGTGDYTIEAWVRFSRTDTYQAIIDFRTNNGAYPFIVRDTDGDLYYFINGSRLIDNIPARENNVWHHIAVVRSSGTTNFYLNGVSEGSASDSTNYIADQNVDIGASTNDNDFFGYISNLRITKEALYTSTFTPPYSELKVLSNTVLLCCQDSDNPTQEATGKTLTGYNGLSDTDLVKQQPKVIPPYGVDAGNTFNGAIAMNSSSWMYFPTGRTEERGRGRGLIGGSNDGSPYSTNIQFITIQSQGNSINFGDLTLARSRASSYASSTRGVWAGGQTPSEADRIDSVTISTTGDATDFGNLTVSRLFCSGTSSNTRGLTVGGYASPTVVNVIDFTTIASAGDATDFGDLFVKKASAGALSSTTRAVFGGGYQVRSPAAATNDITSLTIATTGNSADFGDLTVNKRYLSAVSSNTRGVFCSGSTPGQNNTIDFITIASAGDATDFGDATITNEHRAGISNSIRGVNAGSGTPAIGNTIDFITIATTGDAVDFGDTTTNMGYSAGCSDSHGGLS